MLESEFLVYDRRASPQHVRTALTFSFLLALACLASFPFRMTLLPQIVAFIPVIDTVHLLSGCIIATILLSLASVLRSRALIALGTGYAFVGFIAIAHALTYPETFSRTGLLGARHDTVTWLYLAWHTALPAAIIAYARLKDTPHRMHNPARLPGRAVLACLAAAALAATAVTWFATVGEPLVSATLRLSYASGWHYLVILLTAGTMILLWRGLRSILDLVLMLTLWASLLEYVLVLPPAPRFSVGWYGGRMMGLLAGLFVLLMLLIEMSRLYARTVVLITSQKRERENRLMVGEAIGAFIAHELRQPLTAIGLNAYTAQKMAAGTGGELPAVIDDLVKDSRRASDIIDSTRAIFDEAAGRRPTDINQVVRDTLTMTSRELKSHGIEVELHLEDHLPRLVVNPLQMQQVLMNLFINAAEAMKDVAGRARLLKIRSSSADAGLIIRVEDSGASIKASDQDRIFDPFFTTKKHGTGMGLSICRAVLIAHGGSIHMVPGTSFGARFEIFLPYALAVNSPAEVGLAAPKDKTHLEAKAERRELQRNSRAV